MCYLIIEKVYLKRNEKKKKNQSEIHDHLNTSLSLGI